MIYREQPSPGYEQLKSMALAFVRRMKVGEEPGAYKKEACESGPSTYGAYHAAVILSLFGELDREGRENLDRWAERINALQCPGGRRVLFQSPRRCGAAPRPGRAGSRLALHAGHALDPVSAGPQTGPDA